MNKIVSTMLAMLLMLASFSTTASAAKKNSGSVAYTVLNNYYHNNNAPLPSSPLITTQKEFDEQFGTAAYMGKGGQPTKVNFKRQAVLAIVLPLTNKTTVIDSVSVKVTGANQLTLAYTVHEGGERGYTTQPMQLMAIDKKYGKYQVKVVPTVVKDVFVNTEKYDFVSYIDNRHSIRLNVDYPTENGVLGDSLRQFINNRLANVASLYTYQSKSKIFPYKGKNDSKSFVQYYADLVADSMDVIDKEVRKFNDAVHCGLDASVKRVYEDEKIVGYEADGYMYMCGAHGESFCYGATFDKATGKQVKIVNESPKLLQLVTERLRRDWNMQDLHFEKEPVPMPQVSPYISADGKIKFIYQPYEIGAGALGMPTCSFYPYELEDYLTTEGKKLAY